jgi:histidinol-phosphate/aromatic aminotransferase/cobyric acid decarboxylase-like protein
MALVKFSKIIHTFKLAKCKEKVYSMCKMAGPESNYVNFDDLENDHTALRPKPYSDTYIEVQELKGRLKPIHMEYGESPFGGPEQYADIRLRLEQSGAFVEAGSHYESALVDSTPAEKHVEKRFGLSENTESRIFFSGGGSDEIIERLLWEIPFQSRTRIFALGPCFPNLINYAKRFRNEDSYKTNIHTGIISTPLTTTLSDTLQRAYDVAKKGPRVKKTIFYLNNPGSPKGDSLTFDEIKQFSRFCTERGNTLIVDEAFGDALPDENSAIPLTEENPHLIVLRSLSKVIGLPGERIGYTVMSPLEGKKYENVRRPVPTITGAQQLVANEILAPQILNPHLERVRKQIKQSKRALKEALEDEKNAITVLPTDDRVPIMTIDGEVDGYFSNLIEVGVAAARGSAFSGTHPEMTDRYVRLTVPKDASKVKDIAERLSVAKKIERHPVSFR